MKKHLCFVLAVCIAVAGCGGGGGGDVVSSDVGNDDGSPAADTGTGFLVLAFNDLGMHCMDKEFSVFSILPPFNVVHGQVVEKSASGPTLLDAGTTRLVYLEATDADGSVNSTSLGGKTDFWIYANTLFGTSLGEGEGLTGLYMPQDHPTDPGAQSMEYDDLHAWFSAEGIPITPTDDDMLSNTYPLMRIRALRADTGGSLAELDIVMPVATETDCHTCHRTGAIAADDPGIIWSDDPDLEVQSKINILKLHDAEHATSLDASQPVLCARCHYSPALDLAGTGATGEQVGNPNFSKVMHEFHGQLQENSLPLFPSDAAVEDTCYQCHPGKISQCQRGAMKTGGMDCNACHGDILAVGGTFPLLADGSMDGDNDGNARRPWLDLPRCQSCHTGDAVEHLTGAGMEPAADGIRLIQAYLTGDASASPIKAVNLRFAENSNTLFRFSKGHGSISCEGCHGSTHAIWPNADPTANDNIAATQIQGHQGTIIECSSCHESGSLPLTTDGPHGLHNVNDPAWTDDGHEEFYENDVNGCKACHGIDLTGTPLAAVAADRNFVVEDRTVNYTKGDLVRCDRCHEMPDL